MGSRRKELSEEYIKGFRLAVAMIRDDDRYGIGNMCSQWTADDIADDLIDRLEKLKREIQNA